MVLALNLAVSDRSHRKDHAVGQELTELLSFSECLHRSVAANELDLTLVRRPPEQALKARACNGRKDPNGVFGQG